jgi:mannosyl-oligosaccharide alpha-1,2-mannosidase
MYISPTHHLLYITDISGRGPSGRMEHLSCFFPSLIALGLHVLPESEYESTDERLIFQHAASGLAHTCWVLYADQATGVGPEEVVFEPYEPDDWESGRWANHVDEWIRQGKPARGLKGVHGLSPPRRGKPGLPLDYKYRNAAYLMRPEVRLVGPELPFENLFGTDVACVQTIESVYLMWKTTSDSIWRERGWEMFENVQKYSTVSGGGMASINDVRDTTHSVRDEMPR